MDPVEFTNAYYIKLGSGGKYEEAAISQSKARIGFDGLTIVEINGKEWQSLKSKLQSRVDYKNKGAATMDINALQTFVESTSNDIWITFHASQLWWGKLGDPVVYEDKISRYRFLLGEWFNHDIKGNRLFITQIPGSISKVQRFQGTICSVRDVDDLKRMINSQPSQAYTAIIQAKENLITQVQEGIRKLHWKDFEILVDLLFRNAGWRRVSVIGETMKYSDIELEEPITGDLYQVQIKSQATASEFDEYAQNFSHGSFRKLYFVVHSPDKQLTEYQSSQYPDDIELVLPTKLSKMVVDSGLTDWLLKKIR
ncbi:MAG: hypothetical protein KA314_02080 [Chloroflexi bacterium]|nr:hypothetical protein [Chloroflexota bacterium]MBP8054597.1 hypothetical protein [Chloroflexota bacterium]